MLEERVCRKGHAIAHASADQIADRLTDRLADEIQAGSFDSRICPHGRVEGVFTWHQESLRSIDAGFSTR